MQSFFDKLHTWTEKTPEMIVGASPNLIKDPEQGFAHIFTPSPMGASDKLNNMWAFQLGKGIVVTFNLYGTRNNPERHFPEVLEMLKSVSFDDGFAFEPMEGNYVDADSDTHKRQANESGYGFWKWVIILLLIVVCFYARRFIRSKTG